MSPSKPREIEDFRCWDDHIWDTDFIEVPADTSEDRLDQAVRDAALRLDWQDDVPVIVGVYCATEAEEPVLTEEGEDECEERG